MLDIFLGGFAQPLPPHQKSNGPPLIWVLVEEIVATVDSSMAVSVRTFM